MGLGDHLRESTMAALLNPAPPNYMFLTELIGMKVFDI